MRSALLALLLMGCATAPRQIYTKDGQPAQLVECSRTVANCHEAARVACGGAYTPLDDRHRSSTYGSANQSGAFVGTAHRFELTFRCQ